MYRIELYHMELYHIPVACGSAHGSNRDHITTFKCVYLSS